MSRHAWIGVLAVAALGGAGCTCGAFDETLDRVEAIAARDGGEVVDAGGPTGDGGPVADAGSGEDAGGGSDAGPPVDAGGPVDAGTVLDAGRADAGPFDGGWADAGLVDAGAPDGGLGFDGGTSGLDASVDDAGTASCGKLLQPCPCCSGFFCCVSAAGAEACISLMDVCLP